VVLVLASRLDRTAASWVARYARSDAALMTCDDLCSPGWIFDPARVQEGTAMVGGRPVPVDGLRGVLTLLPAVTEIELPRIVEAERAYVASEIQAFLVAWLSALQCPVINRPTPTCLTGPGWARERWLQAAAAAGFDTAHWSRSSEQAALSRDEESADVRATVVGRICIGLPGGPAERALELARQTRTEILTLSLRELPDGMQFRAAWPWCDLEDETIGATVATRLGLAT